MSLMVRHCCRLSPISKTPLERWTNLHTAARPKSIRVDFVTYTYQQQSIIRYSIIQKGINVAHHGNTREYKKFLSNSLNKTELIHLILLPARQICAKAERTTGDNLPSDLSSVSATCLKRITANLPSDLLSVSACHRIYHPSRLPASKGSPLTCHRIYYPSRIPASKGSPLTCHRIYYPSRPAIGSIIRLGYLP
jgi:hypothetical protein